MRRTIDQITLQTACVNKRDKSAKRASKFTLNAPSAVFEFSARFSVFVWMDENDLKTLRVDEFLFLKTGKNKFVFMKQKRIRVDVAVTRT